MATAALHRVVASPRPRADRLERETLARLARCARSNALIDENLRRLGREWDADRVTAAGAAVAAVAGTALAALHDRRWAALPVTAGALLLQQALAGWSPLVPLLRRAGIRSTHEIERERYALKGMRGDFAGLGLDRGTGCARRAYDAAVPLRASGSPLA